MPFITAKDGTDLFWREWGEGAPMLFLNSLGLPTRMWDFQFAALADEGFRCIGLDRRGHGRSDIPARGYDFDTLADDVAALIERLDLAGVTLVAHSMGSCEVVRYLSRYGARRVARIVLIGPTTPMLQYAEDNPAGLPSAAFEALWAEWRRDYPNWVAGATAPFFVPETSPAMMRWVVNQIIQIPLPVVLALSRTMAAADFRDEMRRIEVPALIVHGDRDRSMPLEITGKPSAALIPDCRLIVYEGGPHGLPYTHMDRLHADILHFVRET